MDTELINRALASSQPSSASRQTAELPKRLWEIWDRMTEMYGHRWTSSMGEEPSDTWARGLRDLTTEQLSRGLTACRDSADDWPPSLPQFRRWCTGADGTTAAERAAHKIFEPDRALEDISAREAARKAGERELANLREMFGGAA